MRQTRRRRGMRASNTVTYYRTTFVSSNTRITSVAMLAGALLAVMAAGTLHAQVEPIPDRRQVRSDTGRATVGAPQRPGAPSSLLDTPVSRTAYVLGPGDVLELGIFGDFDVLLSLEVGPEGTVVVPRMGVVDVLGQNLDEAEVRIQRLVGRYYRNVEVRLTLSRLRAFKVFVVGKVTDPGVRLATSATRVSEVVPTMDDDSVIYRTIMVRRASGDTLHVDLARFLQLGDLRHNPVLREGDVILVPNVDQTVEVHGPVAYPGAYEYRPGETLSELLAIANGGAGFPAQAAEPVHLSRFDEPGQRVFLTLSQTDATGLQGDAFALRPGDAIFVSERANFRRQRTAEVRGEVVRPGTYPIRPDTTTVRELIALAGGFTTEASLAHAVLQRSPMERSGSVAQLKDVPVEYLTSQERRLRHASTATDMKNVVIDFRALFGENGEVYNQPVRSGDVLLVPERRNEVLVSGAVLRPGIVAFAPGQRIEYFVELAGGYSRSADKRALTLVNARTGALLDRDDVGVIEPGDQIVVPYREPRTVLERLQTTQTIVTTISTLILAGIGLGQIF
jgi:polysaccharide biosynthesis/export protein